MAGYRVTVQAVPTPGGSGPAPARATRVVHASCARAAACELADGYVRTGLSVDWVARRSGLGPLGRRWRGRFVPDPGDDGSAGGREPRRAVPSGGAASAAADPSSA